MIRQKSPSRARTVLPLLLLALTACGEKQEAIKYQTYVVKEETLRIVIRQKGEIEARDPLNVLNPIDGRPILLNIVPEGTLVKEGDFLFEVDVAQQREDILKQQIQVNDATQAMFAAEKEVDIQIAQNESDIKKAELDLLFAELDIRQYGEGDLPQEREAIVADITLSLEELKRAQDTVKWSIELEQKGYISTDKLESDRLAVKRREIDRDLGQKKLVVLDEYTAKKKTRELEEKLAESKRELDRVRAKTEAALAKARANLENRRAQADLEKKRLEKIQFMLANNVIKAPRAGTVIYGREGRGRDSRPIELGMQLREGQPVIVIPDMERVLVDVDVHESNVQSVRVGMPVLVTTDIGETLPGRVESVATVADSQSWYRNPDLKVYSTKVTIVNKDGKLKPGMNCYAEIIMEDLKGVKTLPVQAVRSNGERSYCWVKSGDKASLTEVVTGNHNGEFIHIVSGLEVGQEVFLAKPVDAPEMPLPAHNHPELEKAPTVEAPPVEAPATGAAPQDGEAPKGPKGGADRPRRQMSPEDMERFKNMSDEEKAKLREQMGGGRRGGRGPGGQRPPREGESGGNGEGGSRSPKND